MILECIWFASCWMYNCIPIYTFVSLLLHFGSLVWILLIDCCVKIGWLTWMIENRRKAIGLVNLSHGNVLVSWRNRCLLFVWSTRAHRKHKTNRAYFGSVSYGLCVWCLCVFVLVKSYLNTIRVHYGIMIEFLVE